MNTGFSAEIVLTDFEPSENMRQDFLEGLSRTPKTLPCKYFYDERGSKLFDQICGLEEYYPTRAENKILSDNIDEIVSLFGAESLLVELGSGSSTKTKLLLQHLQNLAGYVPIDISREHLIRTAIHLSEEFFPLEILPVCADYSDFLTLPTPSRAAQRKVLFFPGSTIGNFEPTGARQFLERLTEWCEPADGLLIGVDLRKSKAILERAYNDSKGVTAAFNLNLLQRANRELGSEFSREQFRHRALYNEAEGRIEMHLVSLCRQSVQIGERRFHFVENEKIITEFSYKYTVQSFRELACSAGWRPIKTWSDPRKFFSVHFLSFDPELASTRSSKRRKHT